MNLGHQGKKKTNFDLNKIDYEWIAQSSNVKELKQAYEALDIDGYFPDLKRACGERIATLDPKFRRVIDGDAKMSAADTKEINDDLLNFFEDMSKTDQQLRTGGSTD